VFFSRLRKDNRLQAPPHIDLPQGDGRKGWMRLASCRSSELASS
jgi:hypothetical protein